MTFVQDFLRRHTRHLEATDPLAKLDISLGWDAQQWEAPRYAVDDEAFRAMFQGTGVASVSALMTLGVRPAIERTIGRVFANVAVRAVGAMRPQIIGVADGSLIEPGLGSLAGWPSVSEAALRSTISGKKRERLDRPAFEAANAEALDATIQNGRSPFNASFSRRLTYGLTIPEPLSSNTGSIESPQRGEYAGQLGF
jgi:hypothetical protein